MTRLWLGGFLMGVGLVLLMGADKCRETKDIAHEKTEQVTGRKDYTCLNTNGKDIALSFCTVGRTLVICEDTGDCLTVTLDTERPTP